MNSQRLTIGILALCGASAMLMGGCGGIIDDQAAEQMIENIGDISVTIFPAYVRDGEEHRYDAAAAEAIGLFLTEAEIAKVTLSEDEIPITSEWGMNQAKMFRESAVDLGKYVSEHPIETDYGLLPEYLIGGQGKVVGVHVYMVDQTGAVPYALLLNSHHNAFNEVAPQGVEDCTRIVINVMREDLVDKVAAKKSGKAEKVYLDSPVTVLPVMMPGGPAKNVGEALGLVLEKELGMTEIYPSEVTFTRPEGADFDEVAEAFGQFIIENPVGTEYAMYAEIEGTRNPPQVLEVRALVADKHGAIVWRDIQTPDDADFKRLKVRNPMTCCVLVSQRFGEILDRSRVVAKSEGAGRMEDLWSQKSGLPPQAEHEAIEARQVELKAEAARAKILVFPVQVNQELDTGAAEHLAELLKGEGCSRAVMSEEQARFEIASSSNEQKRLWDLARAARDYVREHQPNADYTVFAEYTIRPSDQAVWSVHTIMCNRAGEWVIVDFQNEYQADFKRVKPKTRDDCGRLAVKRIKAAMQ